VQKIIDILKKSGIFIFKYKFSILCFFYLGGIVYFSSPIFSKPAVINILSIFCLFHLFSRIKYKFIPSLLLSVILSFDVYFAFVYRNHASQGAIASIFETDILEAKGMAEEFLLIGIMILIISTSLVYLSVKEFSRVRFPAKYSFLALCLFWFLFIPFMIYRKATVKNFGNTFWEQPLSMSQHLAKNDFPLVYNDILCILSYQNEMRNLKKYAYAERQLPDGIIYCDSIKTPQKIYLIFGEAATRNHMSLYGYEKGTTPFFDSLTHANPSIIEHHVAISPANITRSCVRIALSFSTPGNIKKFYTQKNIIDLANDAGYETYWISNQAEKIGIYDSYAGFISTNADHSMYAKVDKPEDFTLIPRILETKENGKKQFYLLHLHGSHFPYDSRSDSIDIKAIPGDDMESQYDRTIYHTDRLFRMIYEVAAEDESSIIYYVSDHGEIMNIGQGHGHLYPGTEQFDIPLVTINNSSTPIASIVGKYTDPESALINSSNTIYIISEILGYRVSCENIQQAIEDGLYVYQVDGNTYLYSDIQSGNILY